MKKMILAVVTALVSMVSMAQFSFGVQATANLSHATANSQYPEVTYKKTSVVLPSVGLVTQYNLSKKFAIRSGISYLQSGVNLKNSGDDETGASTRFENRLHYLQVPVSLLYNIHAGETKVYIGAGGYAGYGIDGKSKATLSYFTGEGGTDEIVTKETLPLFKKSENGGVNFTRADFGVSAMAGVQLKNGFFVNAGYQRGLRNIHPVEDPIYNKYKNHGVQLTVGYFFSR